MTQARLAGVLYLIVIAAGFFANGVVHADLVVTGDPAATARNVLAAETFFRLGLAAQIVMYACYGGVTAILYAMFKPGGAGLSLFAACLSLTGIAIGAADALTDAGALFLFQTDPVLGYALLRLHGAGFSLALVFFGSYLAVLGVLILRSRIVPRVIGALLMLEGLCYLVFKFGGFVAPALTAHLPFDVLLAASLAEVSLALWLAVDFRSSARRATSRS